MRRPRPNDYHASFHQPDPASRDMHCDPSSRKISSSKLLGHVDRISHCPGLAQSRQRYQELPATTTPEQDAISVRTMQIDIIESRNLRCGWNLHWR
jgi:hypothetical protein